MNTHFRFILRSTLLLAFLIQAVPAGAEMFQLFFTSGGEEYYVSSREVLVYRDLGSGKTEFAGSFYTDSYGRIDLDLDAGSYILSCVIDKEKSVWLGAGIRITGGGKMKKVLLK